MQQLHPPACCARSQLVSGATLLAWLAVALSGCAQVVRKGGFSDVQNLVSERGVSGSLEWRDGSAEEQAAEDAVAQLLGRELTPDTAVQIALLRNPSLQATYEELGVAQANLVQAGLLKNPVFTAAALFGGVSPTYDFDVAQNFLDALLIPARKRIAGVEFERARLQVAGEVFDLTANVRAAFYTLQGAELLVDVLSRALEAAEASRDFAQELHAAGNISDLQLATERSLVEDVRADRMRATAATVEPREGLRELLGLSTSDAEWSVARALPGLPDRDPGLGEVLEIAGGKRLELAAARSEETVLAETLETARFWRYFGGDDIGAEAHREQGENNWVSGPSLSLELPIFDQRQAEIAKLEAQLRQSERRTEAVRLSVAAEVRRAYGRLNSARTLAEHYRDALIPARSRVVALSQDFYNFMLLGAFDLLSAKRSEISGYADYIDAVRDYWIAAAELEKAVGASVPIRGQVTATTLPLAEAEIDGRSHHHGTAKASAPPGTSREESSSHAGHQQHGGH